MLDQVNIKIASLVLLGLTVSAFSMPGSDETATNNAGSGGQVLGGRFVVRPTLSWERIAPNAPAIPGVEGAAFQYFPFLPRPMQELVVSFVENTPALKEMCKACHQMVWEKPGKNLGIRLNDVAPQSYIFQRRGDAYTLALRELSFSRPSLPENSPLLAFLETISVFPKSLRLNDSWYKFEASDIQTFAQQPFWQQATHLGLGSTLMEHDAIDTLALVFPSDMKSLSVSGQRLSPSFFQALQFCEGLEELKLDGSSCHNWRTTLDEIAHELQPRDIKLPKNLKKLTLTQQGFNDGSVGFLNYFLPLPTLTHLDLSHNSRFPLDVLKGWMQQESLQNLTSLNLADTGLKGKIGELPLPQTLTHLSIGSNNFEKQDFQALGKKGLPDLHTLVLEEIYDLSQPPLANDLIAMTHQFPGLRVLDLSVIKLGYVDEPLTPLPEGLTTLILYGTKIRNDQLATWPLPSTLEKLNLGWNYRYGDEKFYPTNLPQSLTYLDMRHADVTEESAKEIKQSLPALTTFLWKT